MPTCPYCMYVERQVEGNPNFQIVDIGSHVKLLKEFLALRDKEPVLVEAKKKGDLGIPCFVREDGSVTLEPSEVGLHSYSEVLSARSHTLSGSAASSHSHGDAPSCKIDGSGC